MDKHTVFLCPSWFHWLPTLALLERRKVHSVFPSGTPTGIVAHKHLDQRRCQLPSRIFCWVKHSNDWSFASACCSWCSCFPRILTGVQTLRLKAPLNVVPLFCVEPFLSSYPLFRVCQPFWASHGHLRLVIFIVNFDRWTKSLIHYRGKHMYSACCQRSVLRQELIEGNL